jgi:hypothetical protein
MWTTEPPLVTRTGANTRDGTAVPNLPSRAPSWPGSNFANAAVGASGSGLLFFGFLLFAFLLVIPNAVRWLRPALALGLSPAYVALGERPG